MTGRTSIEWTWPPGHRGAVWNTTTGCTRVSAGCDNCYAFALHDRRYKAQLDACANDIEAYLLGPKHPNDKRTLPQIARGLGIPLPFPKQYDLPFSRVQLLEDRLDVPLRMKKPTCYFVDSMADLFHEDVPRTYLDDVFEAMLKSSIHRFLVLTKRPERMRRFVEEYVEECGIAPNIWLGTSVEDQQAADERIPHLLSTPAAVRFLSCEPLLGPIDLGGFAPFSWTPIEPSVRKHLRSIYPHGLPDNSINAQLSRMRLDWLIVGGESGLRARPMDLAWARSLVQQCKAAGVATFVKQLGSRPYVSGCCIHGPETHNDPVDGYSDCDGEECGDNDNAWVEGRLDRAPWRHDFWLTDVRESHGRDITEWPEDLQVREFPR